MRVIERLLTFFHLNAMLQANSFLYYLGCLPVLGRLLPEKLYRMEKTKLVFSLGGSVVNYIKRAVGVNVLYLVMFSLGPGWCGYHVTQGETLWLYLVTGCLVPSMVQCAIFTVQQSDYTYLTHFMINPADYYHYKIGRSILENMISPLPVLIYLMRDPMMAFLACCAKIFFSLSGCILFLHMYDKKKKLIKKSVRYLSAFFLSAGAYLYIVYGMTLPNEIKPAAAAVICTVLLLCSGFFYVRLMHYKGYKQIAVQYANRDVVTLHVSVVTNAEESETAVGDMEWTEGKKYYEEHSKLDPISYVNQTFFKRLRKHFVRKERQAMVTCAIVGVICGLLI